MSSPYAYDPYGPTLPAAFPPANLPMVLKAMEDEATAAEFYRDLLHKAPNDYARDFIRHAMEDELKHFQMLSRFYYSMTGITPPIVPRSIHCKKYYEGLRIAVADELTAAEEYRTLLLSTPDRSIRDLFFELMTDEMGHATSFAALMADYRK